MAAARAAYVAGFATSSNLAARQRYGVPTAGTSAHSFTLLHDSESDAFRAQVSSLGRRDDAAGRHLRHPRGGPGRRRDRRDPSSARSGSTPATSACSPARCAPSSTTSARRTPGSWSPATSTSSRSPRWPRRRSTRTASAPSWSPARGHPTCGFVYKLVSREDDDGRDGLGGEEEHRQDLDRWSQVRPAPAIGRRRGRGRGGRDRRAAGRRRRRPAAAWSRSSATARWSAARPSTRHAHGTRQPAPSCRGPRSRCRAASPSSRRSTCEAPMALLTCDFFSDALQLATSMTVVLPQQTEEQIGAHGRALGRAAPAALPAARPLRRPHGLAPLHRRQPVRREGRARGRDAGGAPQLLRRRGTRPPLLGVRLRGAARRRPRVLPRHRPARGDLRGRTVDGRLRRAQARPDPSRAVRRRRLALGRRRPAHPDVRSPSGPTSSIGSSGARSRTRTTMFTLLRRGVRRTSAVPGLRHRRPAAARHREVRRRCDAPRGSTSPSTCARAPTSGPSGTR